MAPTGLLFVNSNIAHFGLFVNDSNLSVGYSACHWCQMMARDARYYLCRSVACRLYLKVEMISKPLC